jgi:DNA mismatch repair ATPase MutS
MKSFILSILLSQTIGVSNCSQITFKPFHSIHAQIVIPNQVGKASLFEAEIESYGTLFNNLDQNLHLFVSDELFSGTNHNDSNTSSYALYKYMSTLPNVMKVISTHHFEILQKCGDLIDQYRFDNYKIFKGLYIGSNLIQVMNKFKLNKEIINNVIHYQKHPLLQPV